MSGLTDATSGGNSHKNLGSDNILPHAVAISFLFHLVLISVVADSLLLTSNANRPSSIRVFIQPTIKSDSERARVLLNSSSPAPPSEAKDDSKAIRNSGEPHRLAASQQPPEQSTAGPQYESVTPPSLLEIEEDGLHGLNEGANAEGSLVARVTISQYGRATHIKVLHSSLPAQVEEQVVSRLYWARYRPGEKDGHPVESVMFLEINASPDAKY